MSVIPLNSNGSSNPIAIFSKDGLYYLAYDNSSENIIMSPTNESSPFLLPPGVNPNVVIQNFGFSSSIVRQGSPVSFAGLYNNKYYPFGLELSNWFYQLSSPLILYINQGGNADTPVVLGSVSNGILNGGQTYLPIQLTQQVGTSTTQWLGYKGTQIQLTNNQNDNNIDTIFYIVDTGGIVVPCGTTPCTKDTENTVCNEYCPYCVDGFCSNVSKGGGSVFWILIIGIILIILIAVIAIVVWLISRHRNKKKLQQGKGLEEEIIININE